MLYVYDAQGQLVRRLWRGPLAVGAHQLFWDGRDEVGQPVATGVYLYRLSHRPTGPIAQDVADEIVSVPIDHPLLSTIFPA